MDKKMKESTEMVTSAESYGISIFILKNGI